MANLDYLYNPDAAKAHFSVNYVSAKKLGFQVIEHGTILTHKDFVQNGNWTWRSGGIFNSKGEFVPGSGSRTRVISGNYTPPLQQSIQHSSKTVIYLGLFYPAWGHFITDCIRHLWFLKSEFMNEFKNCPLVYLTFGDTIFDSSSLNFRRLLEILEIDIDKCRKIEQPTQFDKIILPDSSFGAIATNEYRDTIDRVRNFALKNRTPTSNKKIYYFHGRIQVGEERLAEYFKSKGYEIISPQKLTLDEQLNWLINCEIFASTLGSCSHNSVFLRDRTDTIIIPREGIYGRDYQLPLDQINLVNATYIDSTMSIFDKGNRYHCYIISEQLKKFFGDKWTGYEEDDFKIFLQYVKISLNKGFDIDSREKNYYDFSPLFDFLAQLRKYENLIVAYNMPPRWEYFRPLLNYQTHVDTKAWSAWNSEEQISNPLNQKFDIQAVKINFPSHKVYYSVYYNDKEGWSEEVISPEMAGTTGKAKSIYGIKIRLDESGAKEFDILYRVHKFDDTWTAWAKNGEAIYSHGVKLNAIQIKLEHKT